MTGLLLTLLVFPLVGLAATRLVGPSSCYLFGLGISGFVLYIALLLHIPLIASAIALVVASAVVLLLRPVSLPGRSRVREFLNPPAVIAALPFAAFLFVTAVVPLHDFDGRAFWLLKAKAIATERQIDGPFFQGAVMHNPRNRYPLLVPIDAAAIMTGSRDVDDRPVRWIYPLALLALAMHARRWTGWWWAALLPWIPQFAVAQDGGVTSAYNDVIVATFAGCALFELVEGESPVRFGFWLAFLTLTKSEGLPFALVLFVAGAFVFARRIAPAAVTLAAAMTTLFIWRARIPPSDEEDFLSRLPHLFENAGRAGPALVRMAQHALAIPTWGFFWIFVAAAAAVLLLRRDVRVVLPLVVLVAMTGVYCAAYVVSVWITNDLIDASVDRLLMHLVVPGLYLIALAAKDDGASIGET